MSPAPLLLDANASVPPLPEALAALAEAAAQGANPSSPHQAGRAARRRLDEDRRAVAEALGADPRDVVVTSGATEANRWLVDALVRRARDARAPVRVWASPLEHPSVDKPLQRAAADGALDVTVGDLAPDGALVIDGAQLAGVEVAFCTSAHNETGVIPDLDALLAAVDPGALVFTDVAQSLGRLGPPPAGVAAASASAHKLGGVAGAGALLLRGRARELPSPWSGGGQEHGRRPGTEPVAAFAAFGGAARSIDATRQRHAALAAVRDHFEEALGAALGGLRVLGAAVPRLPNTSCVAIEGVDGEALRMATDQAGLCLGFGSACSALAPEPSPALLHFVGDDRALARAAVRVSFAPGADAGLASEAAVRLVDVVRALRRRAGAR